MADSPSVTIPDKPAFKAGEVCELARIQPYVLRSWESEFPDLGLSKTPGGPRIYRRVDVERVLRIRDMVFTEGLTLAGVRRRFEAEQPAPQDDLLAFVAEVQAAHARDARARGHDTPAPSSAVTDAVRPDAVAASVPPASAPVSDGTRVQIDRLKQEMRSLLDMLGRPKSSSAAAKRARRG